MRVLLAVVALFVLSACDPEQEAAVIRDYADRMTAEVNASRQGDYTVNATCEGTTLTLTGWYGDWVGVFGLGSNSPYGIGSGPTQIPLVDGGLTFEFPAAIPGTGDLVWSLSMNLAGEGAPDDFFVNGNVGVC